MSGSNGLKRYNGVEQDDEGAYVYYDEHIAALRRAKAEGMREAAKQLPTTWLDPALGALGEGPWNCPEIERFVHRLRTDLDARAAQIEEGE